MLARERDLRVKKCEEQERSINLTASWAETETFEFGSWWLLVKERFVVIEVGRQVFCALQKHALIFS